MRELSIVGLITIIDIFTVLFVLFLPLIVLLICIYNFYNALYLLAAIYIIVVAWCLNLMRIAPDESKELKSRQLYAVMFFPVYKVYVDYFSWIGAFFAFIKKARNQ